jgi:hypothetical protein
MECFRSFVIPDHFYLDAFDSRSESALELSCLSHADFDELLKVLSRRMTPNGLSFVDTGWWNHFLLKREIGLAPVSRWF